MAGGTSLSPNALPRVMAAGGAEEHAQRILGHGNLALNVRDAAAVTARLAFAWSTSRRLDTPPWSRLE